MTMMFYTFSLKTALKQNIALHKANIRKIAVQNLLTWTIGIFLFECYIKIFPKTYIDNHTGIHIFTLFL